MPPQRHADASKDQEDADEAARPLPRARPNRASKPRLLDRGRLPRPKISLRRRPTSPPSSKRSRGVTVSPSLEFARRLGNNLLSLMDGIVRNKTLDFLIDNAVVTVDEETSDAAS